MRGPTDSSVDSAQVQFEPGNSLSDSTTDNTPAPSTPSPATSRTPLFLPGSSPTPEYPDPDDVQDPGQEAGLGSSSKRNLDTEAAAEESTPEERDSKRRKLS